MESSNTCSMEYINKCTNKSNNMYVIEIKNYLTYQNYDKYFCSDKCMNEYDKKQMCHMLYRNNCPNKSNIIHRVQTTGYYRNKGFENYFCSENCLNDFSKYHRCQKCGYTGDLIISKKDNLSYCTSKEHWDQSCYEAHMGLPGTQGTHVNSFVSMFTEMIYNENDDFNTDELNLIKEHINEILNEKIKNKELC